MRDASSIDDGIHRFATIYDSDDTGSLRRKHLPTLASLFLSRGLQDARVTQLREPILACEYLVSKLDSFVYVVGIVGLITNPEIMDVFQSIVDKLTLRSVLDRHLKPSPIMTWVG